MIKLSPSILAADFARLGEQVLLCEQAGADALHIDVMDGRFVPNISFGFVVVEALKRVTKLPLDVHLMILEPEKYLKDFANAGASGLTIHPESTVHSHRAIQQIKELGLKAGLAINPGTPLETLESLLPEIDLALLMTVNPGFGGQKFIPGSISRLQRLKSSRDQLNPVCQIQLDGGITPANAGQMAALGADNLVAGSAIFQGDIGANIASFKTALGG